MFVLSQRQNRRQLRDELLKISRPIASMDRRSTPIFAVLQGSRADEPFLTSSPFSKLFPVSLQIVSLDLDSTLCEDVRVQTERIKDYRSASFDKPCELVSLFTAG